MSPLLPGLLSSDVHLNIFSHILLTKLCLVRYYGAKLRFAYKSGTEFRSLFPSQTGVWDGVLLIFLRT